MTLEASEEHSENNIDHDSETIVNDKKRKATDSSTASVKKKIKARRDLYKQPTPEELSQLRETENLFHSNLFRLQIEEVLNEVQITKKYKNLLETWFENFQRDLNSMKDSDAFELNDETLFENCNIKIPMKTLSDNYDGTFKFLKPSNIMIGGSYLLDTTIGPDASVDILVEMPEQVFRKSDFKNYAYMRKKAIYLAYIAKNLNKELIDTMYYIGNHSNPILKIIPNGKLSKRITIYIHLAVQETSFNVNKLTPEKNNVKHKWFFKDSSSNNVINTATPYYNSAVLYDLTTLKSNLQNAKLIKEYPNIRDGIILLKIWLKQRNFSNNFETFNGHIITMFVLYLLLTKKVNTFMSSYQIVRNTWQFLAKGDCYNSGISLCQEGKINERITEYHKYYDCVFLDFTGFHNIASYIFKDTFKWISDQAEISMQFLNSTRFNGFQELFMRKVPFYKVFDEIICIHNVRALENILNANIDESSKLNYGSSKYIQAVKLVSKSLTEGLGNRISLMSYFPRQLKEWEISQEIPNDLERLYIGLRLDPISCFSIIEKGPVANLPEAEVFRKFWGDKSELRRFKDATVCEAVVWGKEDATLAEKRKIPQMISKFLLSNKIQLFEKIHYFFLSNQFEKCLKLQKVKVTKFSYGTEEATLQAINAFDALEKDLTGLIDLPLSISGVQGCSPVFRYTEVFPPLARFPRPDKVNIVDNKTHMLFVEGSSIQHVPLYLPAIEVVVQMCTSGKWPDDLEALRMTKAAFYIQIAECLRKQYHLQAHGSMDHIDVIKDGLAFRLRIAVQKEIGLIKQQTGEDGVIIYRDNEESTVLEEKLFHLPKITGALSGLNRQQPSFGLACCLAKRWLSAHLIDHSHMPEIVVELLMASIYLNPEPERPVHQPQVGFLRFLETFARENWHTDPVIVNFNDEMTREEIVELENLFGTSEQDALPPLFIATPYDKQSSTWTRNSPSLVILHRISGLAKEALRLLELQLFSATDVLGDPLFRTPLSGYDCLIKLKDSVNPRRFQALEVDESHPFVTLQTISENFKIKMPIVEFDPVAEYLKELRSIYNEFALFFHDTYGGSVIGVLFKPESYQERDFKVPNTNCHKLTDNHKLVLNISAMIEDFYILGNELVHTIDIQSKQINTILSVQCK